MQGTLLDSVEAAFQSALIPVVNGQAKVFTGKASSNKKAPCFICAVDGDAEEDPKGAGNYWVNVEISFKHTAATEASDVTDPRDDDMSIMKVGFDVVRSTSLDALLNGQGQDLTVFPTAFIFGTPKSGRDEQGVFIDTQPIRIYCCPSILAA